MTINQLIELLESHRESVGNADIEVRNQAGDFDIADTVELVNVSKQRGMVTWRVFIDA